MTSYLARPIAFAALLLAVIACIASLSQVSAQCTHDHSGDHAGHSHDHGHNHEISDWASGGGAKKHAHTPPPPPPAAHAHGHAHDHAHGSPPPQDLSPQTQKARSHRHDPHAARGGGVLRPAEELAEERELMGQGEEEEEEEWEAHHKLVHGMTPTGLWVRAMGSSLAVSLASLVCLSLLPFIAVNGKLPSREVVDSLAAFGVGAMLGDAFLHQLPHAFGGGGHAHNAEAEGHSHSHSHGEEGPVVKHAHSIQDLSVGLAVLFGILLFFLVEKVVRRVEEVSGRGKKIPFAAHSHSHTHTRKQAHKEKGVAKVAKVAEVAEGAEGEKVAEVAKGMEGAEVGGESGNVEVAEMAEGAEVAKVAEMVDSAGGAEVAKVAEMGGESESKGEGEGEWAMVGGGALRQRKKPSPKGGVESEAVAVEEVEEEEKVKEVGGKEKSEATVAKNDEEEEEEVEEEEGTGGSSLLVLGYLNLFSDGVHNFTDGMALGGAFLAHGASGGWSRMVFMLAHELPQEVGDFGILVRSGFGVYKALAFNFLSALMAMAGTALALVVGGSGGNSALIEGFTAGGFIYIAVAGVIPDMHSQGANTRTTIKQLASMVGGMAIAVVISLME